jgi:hypothetical protein
MTGPVDRLGTGFVSFRVASDMFGLTTQEVLGLTVLAAVITALSNLLATILKDLVFARSLERWRDQKALASTYRAYRDPIVLSGLELRRRIDDLCRDYPPDYLDSEVLAISDIDFESNSTDDPHFRRYRLISTVYRFCAFLGWLELYRQDLVFLDPGQQSKNRRFEEALARLRGDLADGHLNKANDWHIWRDRLIFREEQRAIGEAMITTVAGRRVVIGYGEFRKLFTHSDSDENLWPIQVALKFFLDLEDSKDFRQERLAMMKRDIEDMVKILRPKASIY